MDSLRCRTSWGRVGRRVDDAHILAKAGELVFESLVAAEEVLNSLVAAVLTLELLKLALEAFNVLLGAGADGSLRLAVVGALAGEL